MGGRLRWAGRAIPLDVFVFACLTVVVAMESSGAASSTPGTASVTETDLDRQRSWSRAAFRFISTVNCRRTTTFTTTKECQRLAKVELNSTNVYLAAPSSTGGKLVAVYPDSSVQSSDAEFHDGVLAVDPYPEANFGHLVIVFYIDLNLERTECQQEGGGAWIEENGDCLQLAFQRRCRNSLTKRKRRRNFARRCEINFLPLVHFRSDVTRRHQQLVCRPDLGGSTGSLLPCPPLIGGGGVAEDEDEAAAVTSCDPLRENTKRCETSHEIFESACHVLKICDQAVVLSGGWNAWTVRRQQVDGVRLFHRMLRNNGFDEKNIKVFYADGRLPPPPPEDVTSRRLVSISRSGDRRSSRRSTVDPSSSSPISGSVDGDLEVYPATESKMAMRYEIQRLCSTAHCVESFVLFLNSPSTIDGSILLWDVNRDGVAEAKERYSVDELMSDLTDCKARHLHVIVDQSYSGNFVRALRRLGRRHASAFVYVSGKDSEYSYAGEFTKIWTRANHTNTCTKAVFKRSKRKVVRSSPQIYVGGQTSSVNIFGAPCDVMPPLTHEELRQNYLGCQNLPWTMKLLRSTPTATPNPSQPMAPSHHDNATTAHVVVSTAGVASKRRPRVNRH